MKKIDITSKEIQHGDASTDTYTRYRRSHASECKAPHCIYSHPRTMLVENRMKKCLILQKVLRRNEENDN